MHAKLIPSFTVPLANPKFPEGTVAGLYKAAVATKPEYDCVRVDSQSINWSLKELDVSEDECCYHKSLFLIIFCPHLSEI